MRFLVLGFTLLVTSCATAPMDSNELVLTSPKTFTQGTSGDWNRIIHTINTTKHKHITINWSGFGGNVSLGRVVINGITAAKVRGKIVTINVQQYSASMHAIVPCYGSKINFTSTGTMMFHIRSTNGYPDHSQAAKNEAAQLMRACVSKGVISSRDIKVVQEGKELIRYPDGTTTSKPDKRLK